MLVIDIRRRCCTANMCFCENVYRLRVTPQSFRASETSRAQRSNTQSLNGIHVSLSFVATDAVTVVQTEAVA